MKQKITEFIYSHREEMVDTIRQLVEIPSVKSAVRQGASESAGQNAGDLPQHGIRDQLP